MFKQCFSEAAYVVSTNVSEQEEVWEQSEVAAGFYSNRLKQGENWLFAVTESRVWAEASRGHLLTMLMTKRDYQYVFPSEVTQ